MLPPRVKDIEDVLKVFKVDFHHMDLQPMAYAPFKIQGAFFNQLQSIQLATVNDVQEFCKKIMLPIQIDEDDSFSFLPEHVHENIFNLMNLHIAVVEGIH